MRVAGFCLADQVEVLPDQRVHLHGGWPEFWQVDNVPGDTNIPLVAVIEYGRDEPPLRFTVSVEHEDTVLTEIAVAAEVASRPAFTAPGSPNYHSQLIDLRYHVENVGAHAVRLGDTATGETLGLIRFAIVLKAVS